MAECQRLSNKVTDLESQLTQVRRDSTTCQAALDAAKASLLEKEEEKQKEDERTPDKEAFHSLSPVSPDTAAMQEAMSAATLEELEEKSKLVQDLEAKLLEATGHSEALVTQRIEMQMETDKAKEMLEVACEHHQGVAEALSTQCRNHEASLIAFKEEHLKNLDELDRTQIALEETRVVEAQLREQLQQLTLAAEQAEKAAAQESEAQEQAAVIEEQGAQVEALRNECEELRNQVICHRWLTHCTPCTLPWWLTLHTGVQSHVLWV